MDEKTAALLQQSAALALSKIARELDELAAEVTVSGTGIGTQLMCQSIHYAADVLKSDRRRILNGRFEGGRLVIMSRW
ncbi:MAG: hypothetical protein IJR91_00045 [Ruminococcus sp.]|nr:hypothetical protein [Ruminococcus sp.]